MANAVEGAQSKPEPRNQHRAPETSPYLSARREWDERYGSLITRAKNWRTAAFLALLALSVGSLAWLHLAVVRIKRTERAAEFEAVPATGERVPEAV